MNRAFKDSRELTLFEVLEAATKAASSPAEDKETTALPPFPTETFFTEWFRTKGQIFSIVFKKNHRVTNIQVAELVALVRAYRTDSNVPLAFLSVESYKEVLRHICGAFRDDNDRRQFRCDAVASRYSHLIENTAAIDVMYGSCVLFLPPTVVVDMHTVCARSGYIHSYGRNIYVRNIYKASKGEFFDKLGGYLETHHAGQQLLFRPYTHEDFTENDRKEAVTLRSGLDDLKIAAQKSFLQSFRIADVIEAMRAQFKGQLIIPEPGDSTVDEDLILYNRSHNTAFLAENCIFLIMDHSINSGTSARGNRHYIVCYDQQCINENPFHAFDENKPAWFDHTTLPHTLAGAMINITRPYWPKKLNGARISFFDCFAGSGTTLLEAIHHEDIECAGNDHEPISRLLLRDNLLFFSLDHDDLETLKSSFKKVSDRLNPETEHKKSDQFKWDKSAEKVALEFADTAYGSWERHKDESPESAGELMSVLEDFAKDDLIARLLFYAKLKAARRYEAALRVNSITMNTAFKRELTDLIYGIEKFDKLRKRTASGIVEGTYNTFLSKYSRGVSISIKCLDMLLTVSHDTISSFDCRKWKSRHKYDLIVTDPPYGFNTEENQDALADVYVKFLEAAIRSLSSHGQLVLALPDWSHTGRQLPAFVLKDFVIGQVLAIAQETGREVIQTATQTPATVGAPPYYWESEKALRRVICHFRFRPVPHYKHG